MKGLFDTIKRPTIWNIGINDANSGMEVDKEWLLPRLAPAYDKVSGLWTSLSTVGLSF